MKSEELLIDLDATLDLNIVGDPIKEQKFFEVLECYTDPTDSSKDEDDWKEGVMG